MALGASMRARLDLESFLREQKVDWEEVKTDVMYQAVLAKFEQHENLKTILMDTRDRDIIEHCGDR